MSSIKKIRSQIIGIQKTKKITKTMEMVAISKMRKSKERMEMGRPYAEAIRKVISHITLGNIEYQHPYLNKRDPIMNVGYIILSTDRGLSGSLNVNLFKHLLIDMKRWNDRGVEVKLALIGSKAVSFFNSFKNNIITNITGIGENPSLSEIIGPVKVMLQEYEKKNLDKLYLISNKFINTITQIPKILQILPLSSSSYSSYEEKTVLNTNWDYIYEPDSKYLLDILLHRYVESQVYQGVVENLASEQAARRMAMKAATDNSSNLIKDLKFIYNKSRQSSITQEVIEIISGSSGII